LRGPLVERFCAEAAALGVRVVAGAAEAVRELGARRLVRWSTPACLACATGPAEAVDWDPDVHSQERLRAAAAAADLGVADPAWAVAETGTVALASGRNRSRLVTLLPPAVLFLVRADAVVATLAEGLARLGDPPAPPPALSLVTGPSRSADIGGVLALGVHGPGRVYVSIIEP
jgi:L-lactate utilization protein LutC